MDGGGYKFVRDLFRVAINFYKTTNLSRRFFGLNRFVVLINGLKNVVYGGAINTIYKVWLSGVW